jgi:hypothetical protein
MARITHLKFYQCSEGKCETCGDETDQVHHWLENKCDRPVYEFQDGDHSNEEVVESDPDWPDDPI